MGSTLARTIKSIASSLTALPARPPGRDEDLAAGSGRAGLGLQRFMASTRISRATAKARHSR
jgi:hypothetical protein